MTDRKTFIEQRKQRALEDRLLMLFAQKGRWGFEGWPDVETHERAAEAFLDVSCPDPPDSPPKPRRSPPEAAQEPSVCRPDGAGSQFLAAVADLVKSKMEQQQKNGFRLLRPADAAVLLGLSRSALYTKIQAGEIPAVRDGRAVMIDIRDLEVWAKARKGLG